MNVVIGAVPVVSSGVRLWIKEARDINVVGESGRSEELLKMVSELSPDVALIDTGSYFPAATLCKNVKAISPGTLIVALVAGNGEHVPELLDAGVTSFMARDVDETRLREGIREARAHRLAVDLSLGKSLAGHATNGWPVARKARAADQLSKRELQVLEALGGGLRNRDIAAELCLSERTVRGYVESLFAKLQLKTRTQAAVVAISRGLISHVDLRTDSPSCRPYPHLPSRVPDEYGFAKASDGCLERTSSESLQRFFDGVGIGFMVTQNERMVGVNEALAGMLGYNRHELTGEHFADIVAKEYRHGIVIMHRMRLTGRMVPSVYDVPLLRRDGVSISTRIRVRLISYCGNRGTAGVISQQDKEVARGSSFRNWLSEIIRYDWPTQDCHEEQTTKALRPI